MMNDKLEQLQKYLEKMEQFNHVNTLLYWDMRTNTPKEGFAGPVSYTHLTLPTTSRV